MAELVRRARDLRALTQKELAAEAGVSLRTVTRIEAGQKTDSAERVISLLRSEIALLLQHGQQEFAAENQQAKKAQHTRLWSLLGQLSDLFADLQSQVPDHDAPSVTDLFAEIVSRYARLEAMVREHAADERSDGLPPDVPLAVWTRLLNRPPADELAKQDGPTSHH